MWELPQCQRIAMVSVTGPLPDGPANAPSRLCLPAAFEGGTAHGGRRFARGAGELQLGDVGVGADPVEGGVLMLPGGVNRPGFSGGWVLPVGPR